MDLRDIIDRVIPPEPWSEGDNIPWNDPAFSARMLKEHLSQEHDLASRRTELIDAHVAWIHGEILGGQSASILDLGCGPGFYANRLAALGHRVRAIDFSPASIDHARKSAAEQSLDVDFEHSDIRSAQFGSEHDLVMLIFGEFHVFKPLDAEALIKRMCASLRPGGRLLLEMTALDSLAENCTAEPSWQTSTGGLFDDAPYIQFTEKFWDGNRKVGTHRYFILSAADGRVERYAASYQGYSRDDVTSLVKRHGFDEIAFISAMGAATPGFTSEVVVTRRA